MRHEYLHKIYGRCYHSLISDGILGYSNPFITTMLRVLLQINSALNIKFGSLYFLISNSVAFFTDCWKELPSQHTHSNSDVSVRSSINKSNILDLVDLLYWSCLFYWRRKVRISVSIFSICFLSLILDLWDHLTFFECLNIESNRMRPIVFFSLSKEDHLEFIPPLNKNAYSRSIS